MSQAVARSGTTMMGDVVEQTLYKCDRCGATNIVAAPVVYQQGTHTYSNRFNSGTSQTFSAQAAAPPKSSRLRETSIVLGNTNRFHVLLGLHRASGHSRIIPRLSATLGSTVAVLLVLGVLFISGMLLNFRQIAGYNREFYPRLHWNWEHTYICRRCGNSQLIPS